MLASNKGRKTQKLGTAFLFLKDKICPALKLHCILQEEARANFKIKQEEVINRMVSLQTNGQLSLWLVLNFTNSPRSPCVIRKQKHLLVKPDPKLPYKQERKYERKNKKRNKKKD